MRPIFALLMMAGAGFAFILQKQDIPETTVRRPINQVARQNLMKHALDQSHAIAQNDRQTDAELR